METINQATFVQSLLKYISKTEMKDRDIYMRNGIPDRASDDELQTLIFRNMMIEERDMDIADIIWNYFDAVRRKWPTAWSKHAEGTILNKTNGFRGLMRFLKNAYLYLTSPGGVPESDDFFNIFKDIDIKDGYFTTENFKPGSSGESELHRILLEKSKISLD